MALRKRRYIPDRLGDGLTISNDIKKIIGIKETEKEILILNESGFVVGIFDKSFFSLGEKRGFPDDSPEVERVRKNLASCRGKTPKDTPKKATAKTKKSTTKKGVKK